MARLERSGTGPESLGLDKRSGRTGWAMAGAGVAVFMIGIVLMLTGRDDAGADKPVVQVSPAPLPAPAPPPLIVDEADPRHVKTVEIGPAPSVGAVVADAGAAAEAGDEGAVAASAQAAPAAPAAQKVTAPAAPAAVIKPAPAKATPAKPAAPAKPVRSAPKPKPEAQPVPVRTSREFMAPTGPDQTQPADTDVALLSAILAHASRHAVERAEAETAACERAKAQGKRCVGH